MFLRLGSRLKDAPRPTLRRALNRCGAVQCGAMRCGAAVRCDAVRCGAMRGDVPSRAASRPGRGLAHRLRGAALRAARVCAAPCEPLIH
ncbi:MAG: hypothetical protein C0444_05780 [Microbacterium sp.]|nr:hypothetical protein [Microbacterium sp.]MBA4346427.1 hypothetical protein [Microbacterium sp.]